MSDFASSSSSETGATPSSWARSGVTYGSNARSVTRHGRADLAEAHEAHGLALQLGSDELRALPFPGLQRSLCLGDLAQEREKDGDRMLRRGDDVPGWSVDDEDPTLGGGLDVHVV